MKKILLTISFISLFILSSYSQCTNCVTNNPTGNSSTTSSSLVVLNTCMHGGDYTYCDVVAGTEYTWTTCGDSDFDTQLSLYQGTGCGGTNLAYNDDDCGSQSTISWTATFTGTVTLLVSQYSCISNSICMTVQWKAVICLTDCSDATNIASLPYSLSGQTTCDACVAFTSADACGSEFMEGLDEVYKYTPSSDGWVDVEIATTTYGAAVFLLDACPSNSSSSCIASSTVSAPATHGNPHIIAELTAGITYYIIISNAFELPITEDGTCVAYNITVTSIIQPTPTNQDCFAAIPLCFASYTENNSFHDSGNYPSEINSSTSCLEGERNDVWYIFTVQLSGTVAFTIAPIDQYDDYDWAVYNITGKTCSEIFLDPSTEVSCNYSLTPGHTGPNGSGGATQTSGGMNV